MLRRVFRDARLVCFERAVVLQSRLSLSVESPILHWEESELTKKLVVLNATLHPEPYEYLCSATDVVVREAYDRDRALELLPQAHAIILGGLSIGPDEMDLAVSLEVMGRHGIGIDKVDLTAASERGIPLTYTPEGPTESTAEHAFMLILSVACRVSQFDRAVRSGSFNVHNDQANMGYELRGKALGVVGFGRIGRRVAQMAQDALEMSIHVHDPYVDAAEVVAWGAEPVADLIEMAGQIDVLTIHAPLTAQTRHLIGREAIRAMGQHGILINTSRGAVVDERELIVALQDGLLGGVGLDVFDPEPPAPDNPLFQIERAVLTPHTGSFTYEGRRLMGMTVVDDVLAGLRGTRPRYLANPAVWDQRRIVGQ